MLGVSVVGATGYAGAECVRMLCAHPRVQVVSVHASVTSTGHLCDHVPALSGVCDLPLVASDPETVVGSGCEAVFVATSHEAAHELVPSLLDAGCVVFDLSGAFRLSDPGAYERWYGFRHMQPELLRERVYALGEWAGPRLSNARLVSLPGCYPTSVLLATNPLAGAGLIDADAPVIVDSISGMSGAGRRAPGASFCEVSVRAYAIEGHRHVPEMCEHGGFGRVVFTPSVGPFDRGIHSTIHVQLHRWVTREDVDGAMSDAYSGSAFVRLRGRDNPPAVGAVRGTNFCDIAWHLDPASGHLRMLSVLDNLVKGASGQGVQCMNARYGWDVREGLLACGHAEVMA